MGDSKKLGWPEAAERSSELYLPDHRASDPELPGAGLWGLVGLGTVSAPTLGQQIALHSLAKSSHKEGRGWEFLSEAFC